MGERGPDGGATPGWMRVRAGMRDRDEQACHHGRRSTDHGAASRPSSCLKGQAFIARWLMTEPWPLELAADSPLRPDYVVHETQFASRLTV